jgi:hypothetical protein
VTLKEKWRDITSIPEYFRRQTLTLRLSGLTALRRDSSATRPACRSRFDLKLAVEIMLGRGRSRRFSPFGFASSVLLCVGIDDRAYHGAKAFLELVTSTPYAHCGSTPVPVKFNAGKELTWEWHDFHALEHSNRSLDSPNARSGLRSPQEALSGTLTCKKVLVKLTYYCP